MSKSIYFGVDVGGTFTKAALVDGAGKILARTQILSKNFSDKFYFAATLRRVSCALAAEAQVNTLKIRSACLGLPGPVDSDQGLILSLTNISGWSNFPVTQFLRRHLSFPVFAENDANCMAFAEAKIGAARGYSYALCMTLGTGVGGGLIQAGRVYRGPFFFGGEVGHIPLSTHGPACECGGNGCLERYVGNQAILALAKKIFGKNVPLEEVSRLANLGDKKAAKVWEETALYLGQAIAGIVNLLNPEVIVIGGGVSRAGNALFSPLRRYVREHAMRQLKARVKIVPAKLGNDAGFLGAALLAREKIEGR
ncbi:MAG: ROK family protein [Candidatus Omnitrophota bacterium]